MQRPTLASDAPEPDIGDLVLWREVCRREFELGVIISYREKPTAANLANFEYSIYMVKDRRIMVLESWQCEYLNFRVLSRASSNIRYNTN